MRILEWQSRYEGFHSLLIYSFSPFLFLFHLSFIHPSYSVLSAEKRTVSEWKEKYRTQSARFKQNFESYKALKQEMETKLLSQSLSSAAPRTPTRFSSYSESLTDLSFPLSPHRPTSPTNAGEGDLETMKERVREQAKEEAKEEAREEAAQKMKEMEESWKEKIRGLESENSKLKK